MKSMPIGKPEFARLERGLFERRAYDAIKLSTLLYYGGLRVSEALQWSTAEILQGCDRGFLVAWQEKQGERRDVPLTTNAQTTLMLLAVRHPGKNGRFIDYHDGDSARVALNRFIRMILGRGYTSHGFRRALITDLLRDGNVPLIDVQRIVGHNSPMSTAEYLHDSIAHKQAAVSKVR